MEEKKKAPFPGTFSKKNPKICNISIGFVLSYLSY